MHVCNSIKRFLVQLIEAATALLRSLLYQLHCDLRLFRFLILPTFSKAKNLTCVINKTSDLRFGLL